MSSSRKPASGSGSACPSLLLSAPPARRSTRQAGARPRGHAAGGAAALRGGAGLPAHSHGAACAQPATQIPATTALISMPKARANSVEALWSRPLCRVDGPSPTNSV